MATQAIPPPPQRWRNCPQNRRILAESPVPTTWQRSLKMPTGRKKAPTGRQVDAKGVTWPVGCGVRGRHFPAYSLINGYFKKPFHKLGVENPLLPYKWQSLPTSFPRAVRSEYPAYIVTRLYIRWGEGDIQPQSRRRFILQTTSLQGTVSNKNKAGHNSTHGIVSSLLFSRWKVVLHTVYIFNILMWTKAKDSRPL